MNEMLAFYVPLYVNMGQLHQLEQFEKDGSLSIERERETVSISDLRNRCSTDKPVVKEVLSEYYKFESPFGDRLTLVKDFDNQVICRLDRPTEDEIKDLVVNLNDQVPSHLRHNLGVMGAVSVIGRNYPFTTTVDHSKDEVLLCFNEGRVEGIESQEKMYGAESGYGTYTFYTVGDIENIDGRHPIVAITNDWIFVKETTHLIEAISLVDVVNPENVTCTLEKVAVTF